MPSIKKMRRRKMNVLRNLQSFSQGFLAILLFLKIILVALAAVPGYIDFDNLPETNFSCAGKVIGGYYADLETACQMFHVCVIGQGDEPMDIKFLCLNGTVFDQETRVCERVDEVDCSKSQQFYYLNLELYGNPMVSSSDDSEDPATTTTTTTTPVPTTARTTHGPKAPQYTAPPAPPTKASSTTRKNVPLIPTPPSIPRPSPKPEEYEYYEEDYLEEEQHSSTSRPPAAPVSFQQQNYHSGNNYGRPAAGPPPPQRPQPPQVEPQKINHAYTNPYFKRPTQLYTAGQNLGPTGYSNYGRQHVVNTPVLAEVSQPKPFEGYRRQAQPSVPLTFPPYERQAKSATLTYHPDTEHALERKDTKRSDPDYYSPLEPTASASDDDKQIAAAADETDDTSDENEAPVVSSKKLEHMAASSYEKLLTPQTMYIANLPKVINTVSVSVSDQTGKKLNLSLANILAEQNKNTGKLSYDDYKEDEISAALLEPFFLDVPKVSARNGTTG